MENQNKKPINDLAIVKMPVKYLDFIQRNPKLQQILGGAMVELADLRKKYKTVVEILTTTNLFVPHLENGTKEEIAEFITVMLKQMKTSEVFNNLPDGAYEVIREEIKQRTPMVETLFTEDNNLKQRS